jgi:Xaa-Pro aminopeptidase
MINERIIKLRKKLNESYLDAAVIIKPENRRYISGFTGSTGTVIITQEKLILLTDSRYTEQAKKESQQFNIIDPGIKYLEKIKEIFVDLRVKKFSFEDDYITYKKYLELKEHLSDFEFVSGKNIIEDLRKIKDDYEIKQVSEAVKISDTAFKYILDFIKPGIKEKDIALELEYHMKKNGAEDTAFPTIVASGWRSSLPHGLASTKEINYGDFVTIDFGAVYKGYNSDMTRTLCVGKPDDKQFEIYNLVLKAQIEAINNIKEGISCREADDFARKIISDNGYGSYFGHGLGHGVGLAVHEMPALSYKSKDILIKNMVVTVEPGVYIPEWGGVRIEDMVLIQENNVYILTKSEKKLFIL